MKVSQTFTIVAGTPINLCSALSVAGMVTAGWTSLLAPVGSTFFVQPMRVKRVFIQMLPGGTGLGYVMQAGPGRAPASGTAGQMLGELAPASAAAPGGSYADGDGNQACIDLASMWIDGSHSADTVLVSFEV